MMGPLFASRGARCHRIGGRGLQAAANRNSILTIQGASVNRRAILYLFSCFLRQSLEHTITYLDHNGLPIAGSALRDIAWRNLIQEEQITCWGFLNHLRWTALPAQSI
jgi:hypothetical protein